MRSRGHPGYWVTLVLAGSAAAGLLYLLGVGEPLEKPWVLGPLLAGLITAEVVASGLLGWDGPDEGGPERGAGRTATLALVGVPISIVVLVGSLVTYSLTDAPAAAWVAFGALLATLLLAFIAQMAARV